MHAPAGNRTRDVSITSPTHDHYTTSHQANKHDGSQYTLDWWSINRTAGRLNFRFKGWILLGRCTHWAQYVLLRSRCLWTQTFMQRKRNRQYSNIPLRVVAEDAVSLSITRTPVNRYIDIMIFPVFPQSAGTCRRMAYSVCGIIRHWYLRRLHFS